jgi:CheY-like chemotaxis protein
MSAPWKILVVDDEPEVSQVVLRILRTRGMEGWSESDADKVLERVGELRPDLILLDFEMPKRVGPEVALSIHASAAGRDIPIIFLSGFTNPEFHLMGACSGAVAYLEKPVDEIELVKAIEDALS